MIPDNLYVTNERELRPCVRITASYPATDGSMPESIDVVWETNFPTVEQIDCIIDALAGASGRTRSSKELDRRRERYGIQETGSKPA